jgi:hypothetical protein
MAAALLVAGLAAGCGGDGSSAPAAAQPTTAATTPAQQAGPPYALEQAVTITDGEVEPAPYRYEVPVGGSVRLTVTSDVPDDLHVHGYEATADLPPGTPVELTFVADKSGMFEVETHGQGKLLLQLQVQ